MAGKTVAVIGTGTMGRGIARLAALHGMRVVLYDSDFTVARSSLQAVLSALARDNNLAEAGGLGEIEQSVVTAAGIPAAVRDADVVIEAVPELMPVKSDVIREIIAHTPSASLVATNTSTMSIAGLEAECRCPGRLVGMHFFNPPERMRLVEVVRTAQTPAAVVAAAEAFASELTRTPIIVNDSPGFVTSRLGLALGNEAMRVLESGIATATAIDAAMTLGYNHPMGPLELADLVGLDARLNNLRSLYAARGEERFKPPEILVSLVAAGSLGRKTSRGFYLYDEDGRQLGEAPPASGDRTS